MIIFWLLTGFAAGYWLGQQVFISGCDDDY